MTYDEIFEAFYNLYRAEETTPPSSDAEYIIGIRLANEAINRWEAYDSTKWRELFETHIEDGTGALTIATGTKTYAASTNMQEPGGFVVILDAQDNVVQRYPFLEPHEVQFKGDMSTYCYFTGDPNTGFTLHLNPAPPSSLNGLRMDYVYYKKPTLIATGTDMPEMADPYFVVNRMLAQRFRASRNPYYQSALRDAEDNLRVMKMTNDSGNWADPWKVPDRSGSVFGN